MVAQRRSSACAHVCAAQALPLLLGLILIRLPWHPYPLTCFAFVPLSTLSTRKNGIVKSTVNGGSQTSNINNGAHQHASKDVENEAPAAPQTTFNRPSLLDEAKTMLALCDLVYTSSALRKYARETNDEDLLHLLRIPQKSATLSPAIVNNAYRLTNNKEVAEFMERAMYTVNKKELEKGEAAEEYSDIIYMADETEDFANSCVFGIGVNHSAKRITIWFRGTTPDEYIWQTWAKNLDTTLWPQETPFYDLDSYERQETVPIMQIHRGFVRALIGRKKRLILGLRKWKNMHPETKDYDLFVTGHSLGGSLATLFGYYVSFEPDLTAGKSVNIYTFCAPPIGDKEFAKVFRRLEEEGKIRLARFYNQYDPIPNSFAMTEYTHVGLGIEHSPSSIQKTLEDNSSFWKVLGVVLNFAKLDEHTISKTWEYLNAHSSEFQGSTLEDMYRNNVFSNEDDGETAVVIGDEVFD